MAGRSWSAIARNGWPGRMNNRVSPAKGRTFPSSVAALSSRRRLVVPAATIRPPACRVAAMRPAVSAESTPFGVHLVVARVGGLLGKMATRRWRRRCRQTRPTTPPTFVEELRTLNVRPHVAQNTNRRRSAIDKRTTRHPGYNDEPASARGLRRRSAGSRLPRPALDKTPGPAQGRLRPPTT